MTAKDIIAAETMTGFPNGERAQAIAQNALDALTRAGYVVLAPEDLEWGECPGQFGDPNSHQPHYVSLNLCSGCLEYDPA